MSFLVYFLKRWFGHDYIKKWASLLVDQIRVISSKNVWIFSEKRSDNKSIFFICFENKVFCSFPSNKVYKGTKCAGKKGLFYTLLLLRVTLFGGFHGFPKKTCPLFLIITLSCRAFFSLPDCWNNSKTRLTIALKKKNWWNNGFMRNWYVINLY